MNEGLIPVLGVLIMDGKGVVGCGVRNRLLD